MSEIYLFMGILLKIQPTFMFFFINVLCFAYLSYRFFKNFDKLHIFNILCLVSSYILGFYLSSFWISFQFGILFLLCNLTSFVFIYIFYFSCVKKTHENMEEFCTIQDRKFNFFVNICCGALGGLFFSYDLIFIFLFFYYKCLKTSFLYGCYNINIINIIYALYILYTNKFHWMHISYPVMTIVPFLIILGIPFILKRIREVFIFNICIRILAMTIIFIPPILGFGA